MELTSLNVSTNLDRYLGLPLLVDKSKFNAFKMILDKVGQKLENQKNKFSSQVKEILLKAILYSILSYCMSVFLLLKSLCSQLNQEFANFWWDHMDDHSRIHWKNWNMLCSGKGSNGLRFIDL